MKRTLLFVLALAVIPVGVDAQAEHPTVTALRRNAEIEKQWNAAWELAMYYEDGEMGALVGIVEDDVEALRWFKVALELGARPMTFFGGYYAFGMLRRIQFQIGNMYVTQGGVPEDLVSAYMWFNLAQAGVWSDGDVALWGGSPSRSKAAIEGRMTREQIAEAQRLSREWQEAHPPGERTLRR